MPRTSWIPARVGCHWTHPRYPNTVISTMSRPLPDGTRMSGYVVVRNFREVGIFGSLGAAQEAVEARQS